MSNKPLVIYSAQQTPRLHYVLQFICTQVLDLPYIFTDDPQNINAQDCCFNYSHTPFDNAVQLAPVNLLFENNIQPQQLSIVKLDETQSAIFETQGFLQFDVLAAVFYVLTRYEEYLPHQKDEYGRFAHTASIVHKIDAMDLAIVDRWIWHWYHKLKQHYPQLKNCVPTTQIRHTYDIDMAFALQARPKLQALKSIAGSILKLKFGEATQKVRMYQGFTTDKFDCFNEMIKAHAPRTANMFFLCAEKNSKYDKNNLLTYEDMQLLINEQSKHFICGIHPSYEACLLPHLINSEKESMQQYCTHHILDARFHYIRQALPSSYEALIKYGITNDFSCGYGSTNGFRAGTNHQHFWFNVKTNETTSLLIHPFAWMDATSYFEHKHSSEQALQQYRALLREAVNYGGTFTTIWHNYIIGYASEYAAYRRLWQQLVQEKL